MKNSTHYRLRALACAMLASATMLGACDDDDPDDDPGKKPPVKLTDQLQYDGGDLVGIKSAIYVVEEDGSHTFYLSPTEGLINAGQMEQADDYLRVKVDNPEGSVNTAADPFEIEYKDISVKKTTMNDIASVELTVDLVTETRLNLYTCVELKSGKTLLARYENTCTEERDVTLKNQYEIDSEVTSIGSVVEWRNVSESNRHFYLYEKEGLTAPNEEDAADGIEIMIADEVFDDAEDGSEIDLAEVDPSKVQMRCGEFETGAGTTGTLSLKYKKDKFGDNIEGLAVSLDVSKNGERLRAVYDGKFAAGFESGNTLKVSGTGIDDAEEFPVSTLFIQEATSMNYVFALGDVETAENPATDLRKGNWGIYVRMLSDKFGGAIDVAQQKTDYSFQLYDYKTYKTYDSSEEELTGTIEGYPNPAGGKEIYLRVNLTLKDGIKVEAEYYGEPKIVPEADISPEALKPGKPFEPYVQIRNEDGKEPGKQNAKWVDKILSRMEIRMEKDYRWQGKDIYDAYYFYFCPETATSKNVEDLTNYPQLTLPASLVDSLVDNGISDYDLTKFDNSFSHWLFKYSVSPDYLSRGTNGYGDTYESWGSRTRQCPEVAKVTVQRNSEDKSFHILLVIQDFGKINGYVDDNEVGTKNTLTIEFRGKATKYSGSKTNDLADDFYE